MSWRSVGGRRPKLDTFAAGHIFIVSPGTTWLNRNKPRPFALATRSSAVELGAFVYGSTRATELASAAACVEVKPLLAGVNANGLDETTLFYPGLILQIEYRQLPPHTGFLGKDLARFREALASALGIGTGSCMNTSSPEGSLRGRIISFYPEVAARLQARFGIVLTEHVYSRERRYQLVLPLVRGDGLIAAPGILQVSDKPWFQIFNQPTTRAFLAAPLIQTVWHPDGIAGETAFVLDLESLKTLEDHLCGFFGIRSSDQ